MRLFRCQQSHPLPNLLENEVRMENACCCSEFHLIPINFAVITYGVATYIISMNKKITILVMALLLTGSLSGCLGNGADGADGLNTLVATSSIAAGDACENGGIMIQIGMDDDGDGSLSTSEVDQTQYVCNGAEGADGADGADDGGNMGPPEEGDADDYNVLYIGHSFGAIFAMTLQNYAHATGFTNHTNYRETSEGASGAPDALWADDGHRENIKAYLDTGEIDVLIMICCSIEFIENGLQSDEAIWNFTDYALDKNPDTRIGLAFPWKDYPSDYEDATVYRNGSDQAYEAWKNLASNLSADYPGADVFTFHHGEVAYELRDMFEAGQLDDDLEQLTGPKETSVFTDEKGHAGQIMIDTGTLIWLHAVHGVEPLDVPEFTQWETDIRVIANTVLEE